MNLEHDSHRPALEQALRALQAVKGGIVLGNAMEADIDEAILVAKGSLYPSLFRGPKKSAMTITYDEVTGKIHAKTLAKSFTPAEVESLVQKHNPGAVLIRTAPSADGGRVFIFNPSVRIATSAKTETDKMNKAKTAIGKMTDAEKNVLRAQLMSGL